MPGTTPPTATERVPECICEWLLNPPTYLTPGEAIQRAAEEIVRPLTATWFDDADKGHLLLMLMLYWLEKSARHDMVFKALFYDWRKLVPTASVNPPLSKETRNEA